MDILNQIAVFDVGFNDTSSARHSALVNDTIPEQTRRDQDLIDLDTQADPASRNRLIASLAVTAKAMIKIGRKLPKDNTN